MKNNIKILLILIAFVFISFDVNAAGFGVTQPGETIIAPGESKIIKFSVQTGAGDTEDVIATFDILGGNEIVELIEDNEYLVPASGETFARIKINVPSDASLDDRWKVRLSFKSRSVEETISDGSVGLTQGVKISFDVLASESIKESPPIPTVQRESPPIPTAQVVKEINYDSYYIVGSSLTLIFVIIAIYYLERKRGIRSSKKKRKVK